MDSHKGKKFQFPEGSPPMPDTRPNAAARQCGALWGDDDTGAKGGGDAERKIQPVDSSIIKSSDSRREVCKSTSEDEHKQGGGMLYRLRPRAIERRNMGDGFDAGAVVSKMAAESMRSERRVDMWSDNPYGGMGGGRDLGAILRMEAWASMFGNDLHDYSGMGGGGHGGAGEGAGAGSNDDGEWALYDPSGGGGGHDGAGGGAGVERRDAVSICSSGLGLFSGLGRQRTDDEATKWRFLTPEQQQKAKKALSEATLSDKDAQEKWDNLSSEVRKWYVNNVWDKQEETGNLSVTPGK